MRLVWLLILLTAGMHGALSQKMSESERASFVRDQQAYLQSLSLSLYQNKEYQIITRSYDKKEMRIRLSDMPKSLKNRKIKQLRKEKDKKMKSLLNSRQYKIYRARQKEIIRALSGDG